MTITKGLAEYIHNTTYADIPKEIHRFVKLCILDWIGVTLGGSREPVSDILLDLIDIVGGNKHATILGKGVKTNLLLAALANGTMSHALDFDDTLKDSGIHPQRLSRACCPFCCRIQKSFRQRFNHGLCYRF